jgi:ribonucleotide monophosphatase NagD (HAD superfamily)
MYIFQEKLQNLFDTALIISSMTQLTEDTVNSIGKPEIMHIQSVFKAHSERVQNTIR